MLRVTRCGEEVVVGARALTQTGVGRLGRGERCHSTTADFAASDMSIWPLGLLPARPRSGIPATLLERCRR